MGLFDFLLLIFVFWVWMGWVLDSDGVWVGFGLVGWVGVVGNGGSVVGSGLFGCFCYGFVGFLVGFVLFFLFWVFGSGGFGEQRAMVAWWVVGCLFVFAMGLLGPWWVFFFFFFFFKFLVTMVLVGRGQWWRGGNCLFGC